MLFLRKSSERPLARSLALSLSSSSERRVVGVGALAGKPYDSDHYSTTVHELLLPMIRGVGRALQQAVLAGSRLHKKAYFCYVGFPHHKLTTVFSHRRRVLQHGAQVAVCMAA